MPYPVPDLTKVESEHECRKVVRDSLQAGHDRMCRIEKAQIEIKDRQAEIHEIVQKSAEKGDEMIDILGTIKGGIRFLGACANVLKWCSMVAGSIYIFWCIKTGKNPFL